VPLIFGGWDFAAVPTRRFERRTRPNGLSWRSSYF